ncbi:hypothetical protein KIL84_011082 [Mauremys mutica]|uniref:Uncharacterized protein n=1 Tax=Mauremys mutica TaxID=74926 RepID=A0A9D3XE66_9SAUR|nr:hypothetical protein KIL84_011082 [Mauremys mutica]
MHPKVIFTQVQFTAENYWCKYHNQMHKQLTKELNKSPSSMFVFQTSTSFNLTTSVTQNFTLRNCLGTARKEGKICRKYCRLFTNCVLPQSIFNIPSCAPASSLKK